jgi:hypothetical protein
MLLSRSLSLSLLPVRVSERIGREFYRASYPEPANKLRGELPRQRGIISIMRAYFVARGELRALLKFYDYGEVRVDKVSLSGLTDFVAWNRALEFSLPCFAPLPPSLPHAVSRDYS